MLFDFNIFYAAGRAVLEGRSPYNVSDFFYPPPTAFYFALWSALPFWPAWALWTGGMLAILIWVARRTSLLWLIFPPVFGQFVTGQLDLYILGLWNLAGRGSAVALALMTLKPQLALMLVPYTLWRWRSDRGKLLTFSGTFALLWGLPALLRPTWYVEWLRYNIPLVSFMRRAPTIFGVTGFALWLWPLAALVAGAVLWWAWPKSREVFTTAWLGVNPSIQPYHYALIVQPKVMWRTVMAGWIAWLIYLMIAEPRLAVIVPMVAVWEMSRQNPNPKLQNPNPDHG